MGKGWRSTTYFFRAMQYIKLNGMNKRTNFHKNVFSWIVEMVTVAVGVGVASRSKLCFSEQSCLTYQIEWDGMGYYHNNNPKYSDKQA